MGIGYYTLHSSCGTYLAIGQDTQYSLVGISLYKCYSGCAFQFLQVLHCTVVTNWARTSRSSRPTSPEPQGGREEAVLSFVAFLYTSEVHINLHLVVTVAGPASVWTGRKWRSRPVVNSKEAGQQTCGGLSFASLRRV